MQLHSMQSDVVLGNAGHTSSFNMDANAKAFRVLSDTLYQNKIGSMVREVSCNAYDSHIMAGIPDVPFQIHMPDSFNPHFSVRDFGLGLDDEGVRSVFTTYFRSTKDQNNNVVGAFGLGSKTPFAYTDAFTIVAIKDGYKRQYSAYIDGSGLPSLTILAEEETHEGNGVEIIVPVTSTEDFNRFRQEVKNQLTFFTVKPEILNVPEGEEIEWMDWQSAANYMNCESVFVGGSDSLFRGVWIVQGVVGYRMDVQLVNNSLSPENRDFLNTIGSAALLQFELGQIEVTPSREGVSYSKYTLENIARVLDKARASIGKTVQAEIDAMPDAWAKACAINTRENLRKLASVTKSGFEAPGYYRTNGAYYLELERIANLDAALTATVNGDNDEDEDEDDAPVKATGLTFRQYSREWVRRKWRWQENGTGKHGKADNTLVVLVRNTSDKPVVRIREFMANRSNGQVFVLQNRDGGVVTPEQLAAVSERIGASFQFHMLSDVDLPAPEARTNNGYKAPTAYTYGKSDDFHSTRFWEREYDKIVDFEGGAYYTFVERCNLSMPDICRVVTEMADAGMLDRPIMAIRAKDVDKVINNPEWIRIEDKAKEVIASVTSNKALLNAYALSRHSGLNMDFADSEVVQVLRAGVSEGKVAASSPVHKLFRVENTLNRLRERANRRGFSRVAQVALQVSGVADTIKGGEFHKAIDAKVSSAVTEVTAAHPLLAFLESRYVNGSWMSPSKGADHIIAYVNAGA